MICLPKSLVETVRGKLKTGEVSPEKLTEMTSDERHAFFKDFLGEVNAKNVNALFESKLLLKNQQTGIINWARSVSGMKPEVMRDILSRVQRMTTILQPKELDSFLHDLASQKLGVNVTLEEASRVAELAKAVSDRKANLTPDTRLEYGKAKVAFDNYVADLKTSVKKPTTFYGAVSNVAGLAKSLKATLDNSVIGRQGLKVMFTEPATWLRNSIKSFQDIVRTFGGKAVMDEVKADVLSRENALNGLYKKEKLAVGVTEEAFPTSLPEKIPILGRIFKASETAFQAFQYRTRADIFDKYVEIAQKSGGDIEGIGRIANSLTGRGNLGNYEPALKAVNNLFFSPRLLKSNIDALTAHLLDRNMSPFARRKAALNTLKIVSGIAGILTVANAVKPGSVEKDPRSSDFGKIRVGDTRFDVTGGLSALVTLASRLGTMSSKSSVTGNVTELNAGKFGSQTGTDVVYSFLENKLSPAASVVKDILKGQDFAGNPITSQGEAANLLVPLPIMTYLELKNNPNSANVLASMISDGLGFSTNTYSASTNWSSNPGAELQQFQDKVGHDKFQQANDLYNQKYNDWYKSVVKVPKFQNLDDDEQQAVITKKKADIKDSIFKRYGFTYHPAPKKKTPTF